MHHMCHPNRHGCSSSSHMIGSVRRFSNFHWLFMWSVKTWLERLLSKLYWPCFKVLLRKSYFAIDIFGFIAYSLQEYQEIFLPLILWTLEASVQLLHHSWFSCFVSGFDLVASAQLSWWWQPCNFLCHRESEDWPLYFSLSHHSALHLFAFS